MQVDQGVKSIDERSIRHITCTCPYVYISMYACVCTDVCVDLYHTCMHPHRCRLAGRQVGRQMVEWLCVHVRVRVACNYMTVYVLSAHVYVDMYTVVFRRPAPSLCVLPALVTCRRRALRISCRASCIQVYPKTQNRKSERGLHTKQAVLGFRVLGFQGILFGC